jgi:3-deoxy-D-arabino-heptulosonate 7-phosphate (DAHP) synthase
MVEVHNRPELALSDGAQALTPSEYAQLIREVRAIRELTTPIVNESRIETKVA